MSPTHLPWFTTQPGQIDTLMVFTTAFLLLFTVTMGVLMLRLLYLPEKMVPQEQIGASLSHGRWKKKFVRARRATGICDPKILNQR